MLISWIHRRPTLLGTVTGGVAGLVAITPAAGFVPPLAGIPIGAVVALICYYSMLLLKTKRGIDDSLDVFAVHGMGGIWGELWLQAYSPAWQSILPGLMVCCWATDDSS